MQQLNLFPKNTTPDHSQIMGSRTCERRMACPGSAELEAAAPPEKPRRYAEEGSFLHLVMEHILQDDKTPEEMIGFTHNGYTLTEELLDESNDLRLAHGTLAERRQLLWHWRWLDHGGAVDAAMPHDVATRYGELYAVVEKSRN